MRRRMRRSHLLDRDLNIVDRRLLDLWLAIARLLDLPLNVDDGLSVKISGPSDHVARDLCVLLRKNGLDSGDPLPKDQEHNM